MIRPVAAIVDAASRRMPHQVGAAWAHSAAVVAHARALGLADLPDGIEPAVEKLAASHPALAGFGDPAVNPMWTHPLDADSQLEMVEMFGQAPPLDGLPEREVGYFLGDLYQQLSVEARKGRALCQTPRFVTKLLLRLSVDPAVEQWSPEIRVIDPSCGTGHILVETAIHLRARDHRWNRTDRRRDFEDALAAVHGVDLDPYAAAVARYRLLVLACRNNGRRWKFADAPHDLPIRVAAADSLLDEAEPLLKRGAYHAVVANPPYITVKDKEVSEKIRARYPQVCHRQYSLALPFHALMTELLVPGGWCAQLTANSFMKREFGKNYVDRYLTQLDLTWVIDTSGAYIPGHGTPTVILANRNQPPASDTVHAVLGVSGEPGVPDDPARGLVWTAIEEAVDRVLSAERFATALSSTPTPTPTDPSQQPVQQFTQPTLFDLAALADDNHQPTQERS